MAVPHPLVLLCVEDPGLCSLSLSHFLYQLVHLGDFPCRKLPGTCNEAPSPVERARLEGLDPMTPRHQRQKLASLRAPRHPSWVFSPPLPLKASTQGRNSPSICQSPPAKGKWVLTPFFFHLELLGSASSCIRSTLLKIPPILLVHFLE